MSNWENDYLNLVSQVISAGFQSKSRAGDTYSLPGESLKIPLDQGFPLLTTRKMFPAGVIGELAAFVRGAEDLATYEKYGCMYWSDNAANWVENADRPRAEWQVGRVYGAQWIDWRRPRSRPQPAPILRDGLAITTYGVANGHGCSSETALKSVWNNMIQRCYDNSIEYYALYGGRGVYVVDRWLEFAAFVEDAKKLPGWHLKVGSSEKLEYQLDKDTIGDGFTYGPETCAWVTASENNPKAGTKQYTLQHDDGQVFTFTNTLKFCEEYGIERTGLCGLWTGNRNAKKRYGFRLLEVKEIGKFAPINQLANVIDSIRKDPYSRRHIVTAWNPSELDQGVLPPCHIIFQFYVRRDELHCMVMMRSVDLGVGLPSDIILYALLTNLVAKDTGLKAKSLTFFFGDTHVYANHVGLFEEFQKNNTPAPSPELHIAEQATTLTFVPSDIEIEGYTPGPVIRYPFNA